jgi:hypothetical protein
MKALTRALLLIALLMALATGFSSVAQAGPAILIETNSFLVWDGDGNEVDIADFNGWAFLVITDSADGVITVRGKVQGLDNHTGRAVIYDSDSNPIGPGETCYLDYAGDVFYTQEWREIISTTGNASVNCVFRDRFVLQAVRPGARARQWPASD